MFDKLFQPIKIANVEAKNRIFLPSLGTMFSLNRKLNDRHYNFYERRAQGGAGIITVGPVGVDFLGSGMITISLEADEYIPDFEILAGKIHRHGALLIAQLFHGGRYTSPAAIGGERPLAPSEVYSAFSRSNPRGMTREDIETVQDCFAQAARRAKEAGLDGVEIIGSAGYLISEFLSPVTNKREDEYGGSFENRARFGREVIEKVRSAVGDDFMVSIRVAGNDFVRGGNTNEDSARFCQVFEQAGVDAIDVTGGWHEAFVSQLTMEVPRGGYSYLAAGIRKAVDIPIIVSNRISDPALAERILKDGIADIVSLGRVLIADPDWPIKAKEGRHREIRPCIGCMQGCMDMLLSGQPLCCLANPEAGLEEVRKIKKAAKPKKVVVIGGGPGGMEAARVAAVAGHKVKLFERESRLGGQLHLAGKPPSRGEFLALLDYYLAVLPRVGVEICTGTEATAETIKEENPDAVIVAEGARQLIPPIKGVDNPIVVMAWDLLLNDTELGENVAVIGGGAVGLETALLIAKKGTIQPEVLEFLMFNRAETDEKLHELISKGTKEVTVFEMLSRIGQDVGKSSRWVLLSALRARGIKIKINSRVKEITDTGLLIEKDGNIKQLPFDSVVLAVGSKSNSGVSRDLEAAGIEFKIIGDCAAPRKAMDAIHEGYLAACDL
jgi:2,4-dienoyl-CoA reductase (NADPH2)